MLTYIRLKCDVCSTEFERHRSEVERNKKLGRGVFCSLRCAGVKNAKSLPPSAKGVVPPQFVGKSGNRRDELSPFRRHLACMRQRGRECSVTLEELKAQWDNQQGVCPFTGWLLDNPATSTPEKFTFHPRRASVDRKDSSKGYTKDNIQFVALIAQFAKNSFTEEELLEFCGRVAEYRLYRLTDREPADDEHVRHPREA